MEKKTRALTMQRVEQARLKAGCDTVLALFQKLGYKKNLTSSRVDGDYKRYQRAAREGQLENYDTPGYIDQGIRELLNPRRPERRGGNVRRSCGSRASARETAAFAAK